jgi:predicted small metal-binding protein
MAKVAQHVKKKHAVNTTTDTIANYVKEKIRKV